MKSNKEALNAYPQKLAEKLKEKLENLASVPDYGFDDDSQGTSLGRQVSQATIGHTSTPGSHYTCQLGIEN